MASITLGPTSKSGKASGEAALTARGYSGDLGSRLRAGTLLREDATKVRMLRHNRSGIRLKYVFLRNEPPT